MRLLGSQRRRADRAVPGPLSPALAARWRAHPLPRSGGGGDAARRRLGGSPVAGGGRLLRSQPSRDAGVRATRTAMAGGEFRISAFADNAGIAGDGPLATD